MTPNARVLLLPVPEDWVSLARRVPDGVVVGVSADADLIDALRARAESEGIVNSLFVLGDENDIPFRDAYFSDAVLGVERTAEIRRVLA
jgi:ubiquinone/menaquinone biosynthesis C-methylase UbiE